MKDSSNVKYPETYDLLLAHGLTPKQATDAANRWPLEAARSAIKSTRSATSPTACLVSRVKGDPPPAAPDSHGGAVDASGGSTVSTGTPGTFRACRLAKGEQRAVTERLDWMIRGDPSTYSAFYRRALEVVRPTCTDRFAALLHEPKVLNDYGPALQLALDWKIVRLDDGEQKTEPAA